MIFELSEVERISEIKRTPRIEDWEDDLRHVAPGSKIWNDVAPDLFWEKYDDD